MKIRSYLFILLFTWGMFGCSDVSLPTSETLEALPPKDLPLARQGKQEKEYSMLALEKIRKKDWLPLETRVKDTSHSLSYEWNLNTTYPTLFPELYTEQKGVLTFRGNHLRDRPTYGYLKEPPSSLDVIWQFRTGTDRRWGGGAGWTGQAILIEWEDSIRNIMNLSEEFKGKDNFVEVIQPSLDGNVYFLDLETGLPTRNPIIIGNPLKGSPSLDARGYPLLYVGEGIPNKKDIGFGLYSLIDQKRLYYVSGVDDYAYRKWGAFDSSALFNREDDSLVVAGENGLFYYLQLNTEFLLEEQTLKITPQLLKYRYRMKGDHYQGIENSVAVYKNIAYFADNGGSVQAIDLWTNQPIWALAPTDDTDSTIVLDILEDVPFIYTATEIDKQGHNGDAVIRKINGLTGEVLWHRSYRGYFVDSVNGGVLATPINGKYAMEHVVVYTIARYGAVESGLMVALNKESGEEEWRFEMPDYAWSSPVDVYTEEQSAYIIQGDWKGNIYLIDAANGQIISTINIGANIEASPAVYHNMLVVATRGGEIFGIKIH